MLILTRKADEEIIINSKITVRVLSMSDGQVKLGISAPDDVEIFRGEIYEKIIRETREASERSNNKPEELSAHLVSKIRKLDND